MALNHAELSIFNNEIVEKFHCLYTISRKRLIAVPCICYPVRRKAVLILVSKVFLYYFQQSNKG